MIRILAAAAFAAISATAVVAQSDPIEARRAHMKAMGSHHYGTLNQIQRGQAPFDQAKVDAAFAQLADMAKQLPDLFPESSKSGGAPSQYGASPKIWESKSDFDEKIAAFAKAVEDNRPKATSAEAMKSVYSAINAACNACHSSYRVRNN